jgi:hypothetical protein
MLNDLATALIAHDNIATAVVDSADRTILITGDPGESFMIGASIHVTGATANVTVTPTTAARVVQLDVDGTVSSSTVVTFSVNGQQVSVTGHSSWSALAGAITAAVEALQVSGKTLYSVATAASGQTLYIEATDGIRVERDQKVTVENAATNAGTTALTDAGVSRKQISNVDLPAAAWSPAATYTLEVGGQTYTANTASGLTSATATLQKLKNDVNGVGGTPNTLAEAIIPRLSLTFTGQVTSAATYSIVLNNTTISSTNMRDWAALAADLETKIEALPSSVGKFAVTVAQQRSGYRADDNGKRIFNWP